MAQFAPVGPPQILQILKDADALGSYHLLLAHEVAANPDLYVALMRGSKQTIIMDNGAFELGKPCDLATMRKAVMPLRDDGHDVIVALPDIIGEAEKTVDLVDLHFDLWERAMLAPFMFIPQGKNFNEWAECLDSLFSLFGLFSRGSIHSWGIPRFLGNVEGNRTGAIKALHTFGIRSNIHLLGFSNNPFADLQDAQIEGVTGIDSSEPLRAGIEQQAWVVNNPLKLMTRGSQYWNLDASSLTKSQTSQMIENVKMVRRFVNGSA